MARSEPGRWLIVVAALLTGAAFAWTSWGEVLGANCLWASGADGARVERFLRDWLVESHGPALMKWNVSVDPHIAQIDLATNAGDYRIALVLGAGCWTPPSARLVAGSPAAGPSDLAARSDQRERTIEKTPAAGPFPTAKDLQALATGLPVPKQGPSRSSAVTAMLIMMVACCGLGVASVAPSSRTVRSAAVRNGAWVLPLLLLAAWPILFVPFDTDAPAQRAAFAAIDVFGDWNHPFLPYLLNRPTTWFSLEPWALRLVPLAFLCAETTFMMLAATRDGGSLAGALAGTWFVCEVRRRHGLYDLSDWDIAGTFLMALLLMFQRRDQLGWRDALVVGTLMVCGVMSSWLMIVVAGVLVGCLGIEAMRGRIKAGPAVAVGIVFALLAALALRVFGVGAQQPPMFAVDELWRQMYAETPLGRSVVMALPVALGIFWVAKSCRRLGPRFVALCLIAVPGALYVAQQRSHVNGGYYIGLVTPLLLYAGSVATAQVIVALADRVALGSVPAAMPFVATAIRGVIVLALAVATIRGLGTGEMGTGAEHLKTLALDSLADHLPIFTNSPDLMPLLAFERARASEGPIGDVIDAGAKDLRQRVHLLEHGSCAPALDSAEGGFYLVYLDSEDRAARRGCVEQLGSRCRDVAPVAAGGQRMNWVLRCNSQPSPR